MNKQLYILCLLALLSSQLQAQDYIFARKLTHGDGLPAHVITDIAEDDLGFLWLATRKGLYVFDGKHFELLDKEIDGVVDTKELHFVRLIKDSRGLIWAATLASGLIVIKPKTKEIDHLKPAPSEQESTGDIRITGLYEDEQTRVWVGVNKKGFALYDRIKKDFTYYKPSDLLPGLNNQSYIDNILSFHYSTPYLWLGTEEGLLRFHVKNNEYKYILPCRPGNTDNPEMVSNWENGVRSIIEDKEGYLWLSLWGGGICRYNPQSERCRSYKYAPEKKDQNLVAMLPKNDREFWVMNGNKKNLGTFDMLTGQFHFFTKNVDCNFNISKNGISRLYKDKKGNLWFWTKEDLYSYQPKKQVFDIHSLPFDVHIIAEDASSGNVWASEFLAPHFVMLPKHEPVSEVQTYTPLFEKSINFIQNFHFTSDGRVFMVDNTDVFIWDALKELFIPFIKIDYPNGRNAAGIGLVASFLDRHDNIWLGTKINGIFKVNTNNKEVELYRNDKEKKQFPIVHNTFSNCFFEDQQGRIWYGTENGFGYYSYEKKRFFNYRHAENYSTTLLKYPMQYITGIAEDSQGRIWLGSIRRGVGYIEEKEDESLVIHVFGKEKGLRSDKVTNMLMDHLDNLWISTLEGLSIVHTQTMTIDNLGIEYGIEQGVLQQWKDSSIVLANPYKYYRFYPDRIVTADQPPLTYLREFKVFDKEYKIAGNINLTEEIELNYEQNFLSFEFGTINYFNPEQTAYAYRLEGVDKDWVFTQNRPYVSYTNLPASRFTFKVKARIENKSWGPEKTISLIIHPPFWQRGWFYALLMTAIMTLIYGIYGYRIKQIKEKEAIKTAFSKQLAKVEITALRAQMNPHFLFNSLNSIKLFIVEGRNREAGHYLSQFAKLIRLILQNSGEHFVSLANDMEALRLYIEMEKVRFESFEYKIKIEDNIALNEIRFPPLLLQPYVENAIWHGLVREHKTNRLYIHIAKENNTLICTIEDNGIGRAATLGKNKSLLKKSMGTKITGERVALTNELYQTNISIQIIDLKNKEGLATGTRVVLRLGNIAGKQHT